VCRLNLIEQLDAIIGVITQPQLPNALRLCFENQFRRTEINSVSALGSREAVDIGSVFRDVREELDVFLNEPRLVLRP
jgi:hypothetical protein